MAKPLASAIRLLSDAGGVERTVEALREGKLTAQSTAARRGALAAGNERVLGALARLQDCWRDAPALSAEALALLVEASAEAARQERGRAPLTEVAWTGPRTENSFLRATRQVVLDLLASAKEEVLLVGYWIAAERGPDTIVRKIVAEVAEAARRGAVLKIVLDDGPRTGGLTNRELLTSLWPTGIERPRLLTWQPPEGHAHIKLHAKVLVADREDALVTSANLTMHAMDLNMEMGVRVGGPPARAIAEHFDRLIADGTLQAAGPT